jgi:hypothetical protein
MPENLVESELFGHEKGAFTGASTRSAGYFEQANRGTLFLDEISAMPASQQTKLLRALQDGTVRRLGSGIETTVDARVIAAMNVEPAKAMKEGRLRSILPSLGVFIIDNAARKGPATAAPGAPFRSNSKAGTSIRASTSGIRPSPGIHGRAREPKLTTRRHSRQNVESRSTSFRPRCPRLPRPSKRERSPPRPLRRRWTSRSPE